MNTKGEHPFTWILVIGMFISVGVYFVQQRLKEWRKEVKREKDKMDMEK
jgi:hypothetical protein